MSAIQTVPTQQARGSIFQKHLIPDDALPLQYALQKAAEHGKSNSWTRRHLTANAYAVSSVAIAIFNVCTYIVSAVRNFVASLLVADFLKAFAELGSNLLKAGKCILYLALSVGIIAIGIFAPKRIYGGMEPRYKLFQKQNAIEESQIDYKKKILETIQHQTALNNKEKSALEERLIKLQDEIKGEQASHSSLQQEIQQLKLKEQKLLVMTQTEGTKGAVTQLENEKAQLLTKHIASEQNVASLKDQNSKQVQDIDQFQQQLQKTKGTVTALTKMNLTSATRITEVEGKLSHAVSALKSASEQNADQQNQIQQLKAREKALQSALDIQHAGGDKAAKKTDELGVELRNIQQKLADALKKNQGFEKQISSLQNSEKELRQQLQSKTQEAAVVEAQRKVITQELDAAKKLIEARDQEKLGLEAEKESLAEQLRNAMMECEALKKALPTPPQESNSALLTASMVADQEFCMVEQELQKTKNAESEVKEKVADAGVNVKAPARGSPKLSPLPNIDMYVEAADSVAQVARGNVEKLHNALQHILEELNDPTLKARSLRDSGTTLRTITTNVCGLQELRKQCENSLGDYTIFNHKCQNLTDEAKVAFKEHYETLRKDYYVMAENMLQCEDALNSIGSGIGNLLRLPTKKYLRDRTNWSAYLETYCPETSMIESGKKFTRGKILLSKILQGQPLPPPTKQDVSDLMWAFMSRAVQKGQGFVEGAFIILDPKQYIYKYLMSMPEASGERYVRDSSHPVNNQCNGVYWKSYIVETASQNAINIDDLPSAKKTIVFDLLNNGKFANTNAIFIKPENHGTAGWWEWLMHGLEYLAARKNKQIEGSDEQPGMLKERIPKAEKRLFEKIASHFKKHAKQLQSDVEAYLKEHDNPLVWQDVARLTDVNTITEALRYGLSHIDAYLNSFASLKKQGLNPKLFSDIQKQVNELAKLLENYDNIDFRFGREVCFNAAEFNNPSTSPSEQKIPDGHISTQI